MGLADEWTTDEYNVDDDGQQYGMTYQDVGRALSIWANCLGREPTVAEAAAAFNMSEFGIRKSVEVAGNPFFYVNGDRLESDGL